MRTRRRKKQNLRNECVQGFNWRTGNGFQACPEVVNRERQFEREIGTKVSNPCNCFGELGEVDEGVDETKKEGFLVGLGQRLWGLRSVWERAGARQVREGSERE